jgi:hypothetical protein
MRLHLEKNTKVNSIKNADAPNMAMHAFFILVR